MVSVDDIEKGLALYLDKEFMPRLTDGSVQKVVVGMATSIFIKRIGDIALELQENKVVKMMGVFDDNGDVDLDMLRLELKKQIPESGLRMELPVVGKLIFYKADVDQLYNTIMSSKNEVTSL